MSEYTTRQVDHAVVRTIIHYTNWPEVREYTVNDNEELAELLTGMRDPQHGEWVFDVDIEFQEVGE